MRKVLLITVFVLMTPLALMAQQDYPKAEIFGGYSYFRANPDALSLNGWNASVTGNITNYFGVEGDFSGHYGSPKVYGVPLSFIDIKSHTFMFGPKLSFRSKAVTPFAHFLIGGATASTSAFGYSVSDSALAAAIGGGIDINVNRSIAIRAFQADYLMTRFNMTPQYVLQGFQERQDNFRFSAGIVFKLGK
jgi:hypothetical protein